MSVMPTGLQKKTTPQTQPVLGINLPLLKKGRLVFLQTFLACSCSGELWPSVLLLFVNQWQAEEKVEKYLLLIRRMRIEVEVELCRISTRRSNRHLNKCTTKCGCYSCWECDGRYSSFYGFVIKKRQDF